MRHMNALAMVEPEAAEVTVRILDRNRLIGNLSLAVSSDSSRSVLVLFGFEGLKEHLETVSPEAGAELVERLGKRLGQALGGFHSVYEPRRGEFCGLFEGGLAAVRSLLVTIPVELDAEVRPLPIRSSLGIAVLPDEATDPTYALALADRRLRALSGNLRPPQEL
jgi:hypothetical protein